MFGILTLFVYNQDAPTGFSAN